VAQGNVIAHITLIALDIERLLELVLGLFILLLLEEHAPLSYDCLNIISWHLPDE